MSEWLTENLDMIDYRFNEEKLAPAISEIEEIKGAVNEYFKEHPNAMKVLLSEEKRKKRFLDNALSYLTLEGGKGIDIKPSRQKTVFEKQIEEQEMANVLSYYEACEFVHTAANDESRYLDQDLLIKAHTKLYLKNPDAKLFTRPRFRNETDNEIIVGQGYFNPVPGELVDLRVAYLFMNYNNAWYKDHPIVKGAKFVAEYFRIQPHLDGNKRTALMALNFILEKNDYPNIYFDNKQAPALYQALKTALLKRDVTDLSLLISENVMTRYKNKSAEIVEYRVNNFSKKALEDADLRKK